jgi:hypothetical protein
VSRRDLAALLEEAGREAARLEGELRARNLPIMDSDITAARLEVLLNKMWGPFDPDELDAASELRALYELDYLAEMSSRMRQALLQLPPPAQPPGLHLP